MPNVNPWLSDYFIHWGIEINFKPFYQVSSSNMFKKMTNILRSKYPLNIRGLLVCSKGDIFIIISINSSC